MNRIKNKLLAILLSLMLLFLVTGCGKEEEIKKVEVKGARVVCTNSDNDDDIKRDSSVTVKFNDDNYVNYYVSEATLTF